MQAVICPVCCGKGKVKDEVSVTNDSRECHGCNGKGWVEVNETMTTINPWYKHDDSWIYPWGNPPVNPWE